MLGFSSRSGGQTSSSSRDALHSAKTLRDHSVFHFVFAGTYPLQISSITSCVLTFSTRLDGYICFFFFVGLKSGSSFSLFITAAKKKATFSIFSPLNAKVKVSIALRMRKCLWSLWLLKTNKISHGPGYVINTHSMIFIIPWANALGIMNITLCVYTITHPGPHNIYYLLQRIIKTFSIKMKEDVGTSKP